MHVQICHTKYLRIVLRMRTCISFLSTTAVSCPQAREQEAQQRKTKPPYSRKRVCCLRWRCQCPRRGKEERLRLTFVDWRRKRRDRVQCQSVYHSGHKYSTRLHCDLNMKRLLYSRYNWQSIEEAFLLCCPILHFCARLLSAAKSCPRKRP